MTKFINIEGIDCSGKSTFSKEVMVSLQREGYKVFIQHFPRYETEIGQTIKEKLYSGDFKDLQSLYLEDQMNFTKEVKEGKYDEYDVVLLDRFFFSSSTYEGVIHGTRSKERDALITKQLKELKKGKLLTPTYNIIIAMFETYQHDIIKDRLKHKKNKDAMETMGKLEVANTLYMSLYFLNSYGLDKENTMKILPIITNDNIKNLTDEVTSDIKNI